jgi:hypothetical protein
VPSEQDGEEGWQAFNIWMEQMWKISSYWPLGGDGTVYRFWSGPASELQLPMLAGLYNQGIVAETYEQLCQLEQELEVLQGHWDTHELRDPDARSGINGNEKEHLHERMGYVLQAIKQAKETGAKLTIS